MAEDNLDGLVECPEFSYPEEYIKAFDEFNLQKASDFVWQKIGEADGYIQETAPFKLIKEDKDKAVEIIKELVCRVNEIAVMLKPILPETSDKILKAIKENKKPAEPLFRRID